MVPQVGRFLLETHTLKTDINSGYTPYDGEWFVGSGPWGNVELLTLT